MSHPKIVRDIHDPVYTVPRIQILHDPDDRICTQCIRVDMDGALT